MKLKRKKKDNLILDLHFMMGHTTVYWKQHMSIHIKGIDMRLWNVIADGYALTKGTTTSPLIDTQKKENDRLERLNAKAMSILYSA